VSETPLTFVIKIDLNASFMIDLYEVNEKCVLSES